jgi:hypothetical protein
VIRKRGGDAGSAAGKNCQVVMRGHGCSDTCSIYVTSLRGGGDLYEGTGRGQWTKKPEAEQLKEAIEAEEKRKDPGSQSGAGGAELPSL